MLSVTARKLRRLRAARNLTPRGAKKIPGGPAAAHGGRLTPIAHGTQGDSVGVKNQGESYVGFIDLEIGKPRSSEPYVGKVDERPEEPRSGESNVQLVEIEKTAPKQDPYVGKVKSKRKTRCVGSAMLSECMGMWEVVLLPHVMLSFKRLFRKVNAGEYGKVYITATEENCRDLLWFCERYDIEIKMFLGATADGKVIEDRSMGMRVLTKRAQAYDERCESVFDILEGKYVIPDGLRMRMPARAYQEQAAAMCLAMGSLLLADELGLGKTVSAIRLLADKRALPAIVVCPAHLPSHWVQQIGKFLPTLRCHVLKKGSVYRFPGAWPDVIITSYYKLRGWADTLAGKARTIVFDECQELRRSVSDKYKASQHVAESTDFKMGLSATPIYNLGDEFFSVFGVLKPHALGARDEFLREWCISAATQNNSDRASIKEPKAFGTHLRESGMMLRRTREDVGRELLPLNRVVHEIETDSSVMEGVKGKAIELANVILAQSGDATRHERMRAAAEFSNKLRQATGIAKAPYLASFLKMLIGEERRSVVCFLWHREVYSIILEALKDLRPAMYTGSESASKKNKEKDRFIRGDTPLMLMSLRSGSGLDGLQHMCSTTVTGELDWSPGAMEQCVGRVYRDGQLKPVFSYYPVARDGADPIMLDVLGLKKSQIEGVRDPSGKLVIEKTVDPEHIKKLARGYLKAVRSRG